MLSRRDLVGRLAAGTAAAVCVTGMKGVSLAATRRESGLRADEERDSAPVEGAQIVVDAETPATAQVPPPWELISPLAAGSVVANGWSVSGLTGVVDGSCVLTLQNERGREHRIHVCRNEGSPEGLVFTDRFDLVVMNGGRGDLPTEEGFAQAVAEVARVLAKNEPDGRIEPVIAGLMTQRSRVETFSGSVDRRLR